MKTPRLGRTAGSKKAREVVCPECGGAIAVAAKAMSVFCPHCSRRVILEDHRITGYYASRDFATAGDIVVEPRGSVTAPIKAHHLTVRGEVRGPVLAWVAVEVASTGQLRGDVTAPKLVVRRGGRLEGFCRIGVGPETAPPSLRGQRKVATDMVQKKPRAKKPKPLKSS